MFHRLLFPALLFVSIVILSSNRSCAQEKEGEIIIISERVGQEVDLEERNKYNLFPAIKGFQSAVFLKLPDGSYVLKITYLDETIGEEKVERIPRNELNIKRYRDVIDRFGEIHFKKPPLKPGRIAGEAMLAEVLGMVGGFLGGGAGRLASSEPSELGIVVGLAIGSTVGSSIGVYIIGDTGNETGSYWVTFLGSAVGMAIFLKIFPLGRPEDPRFWIGLWTLPTLGGIIGFNMTRRYETPTASETALINFGNGQMSFAVPTISSCPNPFDKKDFIQNVDLVKVSF